MRPTSSRLLPLLMSGAILFGPASAESASAVTSVETAALGPAHEEAGTSSVLSHAARQWFKAQWAAYCARFVSPDGRVIDNANGDVSHSEGQGYGLLLALAADDPDGFALIWRWTTDHLRVRPDGLFAWKWDPRQGGVADRNDATDGDILIAWALARAGKRFGRADYESDARGIIGALAAKVVRPSGMGPVLLPAVAGFGAREQPQGPVVNPSYWVFPALRDFAALSPDPIWAGVRWSGFDLLETARFGPLGLPTDWVALGGTRPAPASKFPATFGYDALRVPLYLAWDGDAPPSLMADFARFSPASDPTVIDVSTGASGATMGGAGYRAVFALARCAAHGETVPPDLMTAHDLLYYPETLRLLSLSVVQERFPQCL